MTNTRQFLVMNPLTETVIPILDDGTGPSEWGRDIVEVSATSKKEAKRLGYHALKQTYEGRRWINDCRGDNKNPFSELTVEEQYTAETCPSHKVVSWPMEDYEYEAGLTEPKFCETCGHE